jgi:hypothetical protein
VAGSGFPQRKSQGSGGMTADGPGAAGQLDGPPPSPVMSQAQPPTPGMTGQSMASQVPQFSQLAQPMTAGTPGRALSPEISVGIMQSATTMASIMDSIASMVPDLAADMALQKDLLQRSMAKLFMNTGQEGAPQSLGMNFPGGGFASGSQ